MTTLHQQAKGFTHPDVKILQIEGDVVPQTIQRDPVRANRELRRRVNPVPVERGGRVERFNPMAAIELEPHAGGAAAIGPRGADEELLDSVLTPPAASSGRAEPEMRARAGPTRNVR